jgi:hypothetical protein
VKSIFLFSNQAPTHGDVAQDIGTTAELKIVGWETEMKADIQRIQEIHHDGIVSACMKLNFNARPMVKQILIPYRSV